MLVKDVYGVEYHLNPNQIVLTRTMSDGDGEVELANGETFWPDRESYDRIVTWMEQVR